MILNLTMLFVKLLSATDSRAAQTFTFQYVLLVADSSKTKKINKINKTHREPLSFSYRPVGQDLDKENINCLHAFPAQEIITTLRTLTMLVPAC